MSTFRSGPSSSVQSISDLDGYTLRDYQFPSTSYAATNDDEFGFDPPEAKPPQNMYQTYSPPQDTSMSGWPDFAREGDVKETIEPSELGDFDMDSFFAPNVPNSDTAVSRFGQITPPRSNSASSSHPKDESLSPKTTVPERKKTKAQAKTNGTAPVTTVAKPGRKRKSTRKASIDADNGESPEESKRKQSLEKNRLAAAKCRVNKKEKTEILQRDSHEKAVENAYLKDQIMRMKDEVQHMNAILLAHANCEGCKSPEALQAHLSQLSNDFFNHPPMDLAAPNFVDYSQMNYSPLSTMQDNFFPNTTSGSMMNPPLPEFNRGAEFEPHTPHGD